MKFIARCLLIALCFGIFGNVYGYGETSLSEKSQEVLKNSIVLHIGNNVSFVKSGKKNIDTESSIVPFVNNDRTLVPLRFISENLGATILWDQATSTVTLKKENTIVKLIIGKNIMVVNGVEVKLDVAPIVKSGRTFIPLRNCSEALNQKVYWNKKGIIILSPEEIVFENNEDQIITELFNLFPPIKPPGKPPVKPRNLNDLVKPSIIYAKVNKNMTYYSSYSMKKAVGKISKGSIVVIIKGEKGRAYDVWKPNTKQRGWISRSSLNIPPDPKTNQDRMTKEEIGLYANTKGFKSSTSYFIWTDLDRQLVHIFSGKKGKWKLIKTSTCASGKNVSPTVRGTFKITGRGLSQPGLRYWVRFYGGYMFHSVLVDSKGRIIDSTQGKRASHGCIRLPMDVSKWVYKNIPNRTTVFIN